LSKPNTKSPAKLSPAARRKARHYAMQGLYQWRMAGADINVIEAEFHTDNDMSKVDVDYFHELLHGVPAQLGEIDELIRPRLVDRTFEELDPVELALLRMAAYELLKRIDVPYKVVINEAVSLAKKFGAAESHKFINAVLDAAASTTRAIEYGAR